MIKAYLMSGLGDIYSDGLFTIADRLVAKGIDAKVCTWYDWQWIVSDIIQDPPEKLILVGHSKGANNTGAVAEKVRMFGIPVDLLVALDPVRGDDIPDNVKQAICFRQARLPFIGTKLHLTYGNTTTKVEDYLLPHLNHFTIDKDTDVHERIMKAVELI